MTMWTVSWRATPARRARSLHPDLAKRAVTTDPDEKLALRRMSKEELVDLTKQGVLKTPKAEWNRSVRVLDIAGNAAVARSRRPGSWTISTSAASASAG